MHELALTKSILDIALKESARHGASRVLKIRLKIGAFAGAMPELIQQYYNIASENTAAEGAELIIERVPATIACLDCGSEHQVENFKIICPACGGGHIKLLTGREFYVESLEAE